MIKLIVGTKGSGKTKAMIDQINDAVKTSKGNVVVVEKGMKLTYDIAPPNTSNPIMIGAISVFVALPKTADRKSVV